MAMEVIFIWAPGDAPLALPDNVGFALGGPDGYKSFTIEIHYDNPLLKQGAVDSSGIKMYYSSKTRAYTAGLAILGDSSMALAGSSIPEGLADYQFHCGSGCTSLFLDEPVTVLREFHHMHQSGVSSYNEQIRNGQVIRTGHVDYFDFRQQGAQVVQQESFTVMAGDSFNTRCFFRNSDDQRKFGYASSEEMCMTFFLYYPRKTLADSAVSFWMCGIGFSDFGLSACESTYNSSVATDDKAMHRVFGTPSTACEAEVKVDSSTATRHFGVVSCALLLVLLSTLP
jgi:hypothetical protein